MQKYLDRYAEQEVSALAGMPRIETWANVLVIPACNESPECLRPPPVSDGRSLLILVVNQSVDASESVSQSNQTLAAEVRRRFEPVWQSREIKAVAGTSGAVSGAVENRPQSALTFLRDPDAPRDIILVDRFSPGHELPKKGGVGNARKIGVDLAVALFSDGYVQTPWIHCSDGDVQLPDSYFSCLGSTDTSDCGYSSLVYPFSHDPDPDGLTDRDVLLATRLYEVSLHYYVAGLKSAGSPYAFHTIGSTIAVQKQEPSTT